MDSDELNKNLHSLFFYRVLIFFFFFICMTNIITSGHTIKFENGLSNLGYNSRTLYTILISDTSKDAYNCLQGMSTIFFIHSRISELWIKIFTTFQKNKFLNFRYLLPNNYGNINWTKKYINSAQRQFRSLYIKVQLMRDRKKVKADSYLAH